MVHIPSKLPDLRVLRQFLAVADSLSFRKAAEALQMSQPPLSVAMRQLEQTIGAQLFERSTLGVTLTSAGLVLQAEASRLVEQGVRAYELTQATARGEVGDVRVAFITSAMVHLLPNLLARFAESHPNVRLKLVEAVSLEVVSMVADGKVDIGLLSPPVTFPNGADHQQVASDRLVAIVPLGHRLAGRSSIDLKELQDERFVSFSADRVPSFHQRITGACLEAGFQPQIVQEAAHIYTIIALVAGKLGVALVPSAAARTAHHGVAPIALANPSSLLDTTLEVVYFDRMLSGAARQFLNGLVVNAGSQRA